MPIARNEERVNVALVGAGIMSATLGALFRELMPDLTISVFERLHKPAYESTQAMNNAGTGHAGNCELNYTPQLSDGTINITKALSINAAFEVSLQFWSHMVETGKITDPSTFVHRVPHDAFVWGDADADFLRARHRILSGHPMFTEMTLTEDRSELSDMMPLVMRNRPVGPRVAATRVERGSDVDFGRLTEALFAAVAAEEGSAMHLRHEVRGIRRHSAGGWQLEVEDLAEGGERTVHADFVFLGAGGGALPLLQKSGIPEGRGYGGFPVSGQWLVCNNPALVAEHHSKVYGKAALGAPPMSMPHLDTRFWRGQPALLFGPFAGFTTKYLMQGSSLDLFKSLRSHNLGPMLAVARDNWDLTRYLIGQALQSQESRMATLREYMPTAKDENWRLAAAGQRVQIIKRDPRRTGRLEFGTEMVVSADGSLAALLGASPGASTAAQTMIELLQRCFPERTAGPDFHARVKAVIPSHGHDLTRDAKVLHFVREHVDSVLGLAAPASSDRPTASAQSPTLGATGGSAG